MPSSRSASHTPSASDTGHAPQAVAAAVNAALGASAVRVGSGAEADLDVISSGFDALDEAVGLGGLPRGRLTEIVGRATSGRATIAAKTVAAADGECAWVDVRGLADIDAMTRCGVDLGRLYVLRPPRPIDALAITARLLTARHLDVIVLDALDDLPPGGETGRAVGTFTRVATPYLGQATSVLLVLSAPDQHYRALAGAAAVRLALTQVGLIRRGGVFRGWRTRLNVLKSPGAAGGTSGIEVWL